MMNFNLDNLSEIIDEVLTEFCVTYPIPNFDNKEQLEHLRSVLEQFGASALINAELMEAISLAPKKFTLEAPKKDGTDPKLAAILKKKVKNADTGRDVTVASALNYKDQKGSGARSAYHAAAAMLKGAGYSEKNVDMIDDPNPEEPQYYAKSKPQVTPQSKVAPQTKATPAQLKKLQQLKKAVDLKKKVDAKKSKNTDKETQPTKVVDTPKVPTGSFKDVLNSFDSKGKNEQVKAKVINTKKQMLSFFDKGSKSKSNPHAREYTAVKLILDKMFNGSKLNDKEKNVLARWVRIAEPTEASPDTFKVYLAKEPNDFKANRRFKLETGGKGANNKIFGQVRRWMENSGVIQISTSTFGGKKTTANQTFIDEKGNTKLLKNKNGKSISSVQKDSTGNIQSVQIGGLTISKTDPNEKGISKQETLLRIRNNRNINEYAEKIEAGDLEFIDMDNGVTPDTPENRVIVIQSALSGMAKRFTDLAKTAKIEDDETNKLIGQLDSLSKLDPNKNPQQWFTQLKKTFSQIANHTGEPSLSEGWANFAEVYDSIVEMHDNGKGTQNGKCALLPQSTTLETVDVITIDNGMNERKIVTLDGRSVKKGVGGPSALTSKTKKSTYKNDKDGKKGKAITQLSESHTTIYSVPIAEPISKHTALHKGYRTDIINKAKSLGVSDQFIKDMQYRLKDPKTCPPKKDSKDRCGAAHSSITESINGIMARRKTAGAEVSPDIENKIRMRLESYYYYQFLSHEAYNTNVDVQDFSNDSIISQAGDVGGSKLAKNNDIYIDKSNGVNILAYPSPEFNVGWNLEGKSNNPGSGRFHNAPKRG
jgi:hypothetical protein